MARTVKDAKLDSRKAREKLEARGDPYWRLIEPGLHLGFRKLVGRAGTWWVRHYVGGRRYKVEALGTADDLSDADGVAVIGFKQAQDKARALMVTRAHSAAGPAGPLTVKDAVEQYLERLEGEGSKSVADARYRAAAFIYPAKIATIECNKLAADDLRKWKARLAKEAPRKRTKKDGKQKQQYRDFDPDDAEAVRRRQATANRVLTILKAALNQAWRDDKVSTDKAWRSVQPFEDVDAARVRYLTVAEAKRLINACDPEFRSLVQAALQTGARYSELARLEVRDFNPDAGTVAIRRSKSGKARHVVLTDEGAALFKSLATGKPGDALLLTKADGSTWKKSHQARPMAEACERAKITPEISFHLLRHTWASLSVMSGVPLLVVAKNLGHADTRMCEKHYSHLTPSFVADAIRAGAPRFGFEPDRKVRPLRDSA
jgi:integrase